MMINSAKFSPSFQKKLVAKANVIKNNKPCPVSIYKLDKKEDKDYIKNLQKNDINWEYSCFITDFKEDFEQSNLLKLKKGKNLKFYTIEDKNKSCLGLLEIDNGKIGKQNVEFIEVLPNNRSSKEFKYIGETLLAFLAKQQKSAVVPRKIYVKDAISIAQDFYSKSKFCFRYELNPLFVPFPVFDCDDENGFGKRLNQMVLPKKNIDLLLENNKKHTKSKIELVG